MSLLYNLATLLLVQGHCDDQYIANLGEKNHHDYCSIDDDCFTNNPQQSLYMVTSLTDCDGRKQTYQVAVKLEFLSEFLIQPKKTLRQPD